MIRGLNALDLLAIVVGSWTVLAVIGAAGWSFAVTRLKANGRNRRPVADGAAGRSWPPPVPPSSRARSAHDTDWLADQPVGCRSTEDVRSLFDDIVRGEFA